MRTANILLWALLIAGVGGCYVDTYSPGALYAAPGVYGDDYYWRSSDGYWYRYDYYSGDWVTAVPPYPLLSIRNPSIYSSNYHYHHAGDDQHPRGP